MPAITGQTKTPKKKLYSTEAPAMPSSPNYRRRLVFFTLLVMLVGLIALNAQQILAELYAIPARNLLNATDTSTWQNPGEIYANGTAQIEKALTIQPDNPEYHELHGRLVSSQCRLINKVEQWDPWLECQRKVLAAFRQGTVLNPRWPHNWANVLITKFNLLQFDQEFFQALTQARLLGSSEMGVNRTVAFVGLAGWQRWPDDVRAQFQQSVLDLHAASPDTAASVAKVTRHSDLYCLWTKDSPTQYYSCPRTP